ncbi:putative UPF0481 protein [Trifolium repens]|nr:putative UPF0481 protein [Trifolium repens]
MSYNSKTTFDENLWVNHIRKTLEEELEEENGEIYVSIFNVPKLLMASDPNSYVPQQVAIGPYHYWRQELYEMQSLKLASTKRFQKKIQSLKLDNFVDQLTKCEQKIRACYHKFLDLNGETLVWMMIVDASFLLDFLHYAMKEETKELISSHMSHVGSKLSPNGILRDIVMLENQIPLFVLRKMLEFKFSSSLSQENVDDVLILMLIRLFKEISPLKMIEEYPNIRVLECAHLLDSLYDMIVPKLGKQDDIIEVEIQQDDIIEVEIQQEVHQQEGGEKSSANDSIYVKQFFNYLWKLLLELINGPLPQVKKVLISAPLKVLKKLPWENIIKLPGIKLLKDKKDEKEKPKDENSSTRMNNTPLVEEITIPSVEQLVISGVNFLPTNGSISSISFDVKTNTLYLPKISLDVNTEVFLRNLVAYESSGGSRPLVIARYTEFMNGIIDTGNDAKILRQKGIILNHLKSDKEVANMWNGMSKSLRLTRVPFLDETIENVNKFYNNRLKIKMRKFFKSYVFGSWQVLTFLATIFLLLMTALQAFCSVYTCYRFFDKALELTTPLPNTA